jgi:hypothetical protein
LPAQFGGSTLRNKKAEATALRVASISRRQSSVEILLVNSQINDLLKIKKLNVSPSSGQLARR